MHTNSDYEKIAIIVILSGCGLAIALAFAVLICCQLLIKPKYARYGCPNSVVVFERQTTTSDENNIDYNSGCYEDSFYQRGGDACDSDTNADTVSSPNTVIAAQTHHNYTQYNATANGTQSPPPPPQSPPTQPSSSPQVKFAPRPPLVKTRKTSLPCKLVAFHSSVKSENSSTDSDRRASAGIIRQKSFEDIEEDITYNQIELSERRRRTLEENKTISTDVLRKQYRDLWHLRATLEAEEFDTSNEGSGESTPPNQQQQQQQMKLIKNDSGYKSIERRDYSIDIKSDFMFRQFIATTTSSTGNGSTTVTYTTTPSLRHTITHQQSIKEEQEGDIQATFV